MRKKTRIILEPVNEKLHDESWIFKPENKKFLKEVKEGLKQIKSKKLISRGSFAKYRFAGGAERSSKKKYKSLQYYLNLPWTYTVEQVIDENKNKIYVVRVNELPGICTDAASLDEAMKLIKESMKAAFEFYMEHGEDIPEPIKEFRHEIL